LHPRIATASFDAKNLGRYWIVSVAVRLVERYVPEMVEDVPWTALVVTVNVVLREPAGTVADGGTCAADVRLLISAITAPAGGAAPLSVNVPVEDEPPLRVLGFKVSELKEATETLSVIVLVFPYTAARVTVVEAATPLVVIVNVVVVLPAGIVTLDGTWAAVVMLLCSVTFAPPVGAAPFKVTVPVALLPPTIELGLRLIDDKVAALTVRVVVRVTP
jgi:hypothetical protein